MILKTEILRQHISDYLELTLRLNDSISVEDKPNCLSNGSRREIRVDISLQKDSNSFVDYSQLFILEAQL